MSGLKETIDLVIDNINYIGNQMMNSLNNLLKNVNTCNNFILRFRSRFQEKFMTNFGKDNCDYAYVPTIKTILTSITKWLTEYRDYSTKGIKPPTAFYNRGLTIIYNYLSLSQFFINNVELLVPFSDVGASLSEKSKKMGQQQQTEEFITALADKLLDCKKKIGTNILPTLEKEVTNKSWEFFELKKFCLNH